MLLPGKVSLGDHSLNSEWPERSFAVSNEKLPKQVRTYATIMWSVASSELEKELFAAL